MSSYPSRFCNGVHSKLLVLPGVSPEGCGREATVVCTDATGLQWYACDELDHHGDAVSTMPIAEWWAHVFPGAH